MSYLGFGPQEPRPDLGALIAGGQPYLLTAWWITTLPGVFVVLFGALSDRIGRRTNMLLFGALVMVALVWAVTGTFTENVHWFGGIRALKSWSTTSAFSKRKRSKTFPTRTGYGSSKSTF